MRLGHHANGPEENTNGDGMCRKVDIRVDSYIFVLFSYSIRYYFCTFKNDFVHLTFKTKKNGREFLTFYIRPHSAVDSAQWDWGNTYGFYSPSRDQQGCQPQQEPSMATSLSATHDRSQQPAPSNHPNRASNTLRGYSVWRYHTVDN